MEYISSEKDMILTQPSWWDFLRVISTSVSWQENAGIGRLNLLKKKKKKLLENHTAYLLYAPPPDTWEPNKSKAEGPVCLL